MKYRIKPARQVLDFVTSLPPQPRRESKQALAALANWRGDISPLKKQLEGYHRLRVDGYRFVFEVKAGMLIEVVFAESRDVVYQIFETMVKAGEVRPLL